jgi:hypothetical protein
MSEHMSVAEYHAMMAKKKTGRSHGRHTPGEMNTDEARYGTLLEHSQRAGCVKEYVFEPMKLLLEGGSEYTVDYFYSTWSGCRQFVEIKAAWKVKGSRTDYRPHWEGDAREKFKAARARLLSLFGIPLVATWFHPVRRVWEYEAVKGVELCQTE